MIFDKESKSDLLGGGGGGGGGEEGVKSVGKYVLPIHNIYKISSS